ncbi:methylase involved in ubiquinone/menaquinone biosynthesis [Xenococcus sp. PCC 7305]|uniref:class I SAM-dependent methyltransferase n=1 Tax=Xenococcus sp. PCC 7305 TaxID=102125 RepID=UPI0002AC7EFF|nr:class I SAM-dependent methyltransferase [Xenococcus sp. PCC 7305]ELS00418.1 methylase involved in ubiquinone/menaquinone biosynthesis [Xenococcus sp. PCC 7305]
MNLSTLQKRLFAWGMGKANAADDQAIKLIDYPDYGSLGELKQAFLGNLNHKVVEIGPGAGANLAYYPKKIDWIGVEPNPYMHSYLEKEAQKHGLSAIALHQGMAEDLPIEDKSVDTVVSTHVLCSVKDLDRSLQEIKRILKPEGNFIFIEHVAGECGSWTRRIQDGIEPVWKTIFDNCHPNRETWQSLANSDWEIVSYQQFHLSFPIVSPHIAGILSKKPVPSLCAK